MAGLVAMLALACSEAVAPPVLPTLEGRYELETVNDGHLPVVIAVVPPEVIRLTRAALLLREDGTFLDSAIVTYDALPFGGTTADTSVTVGAWTRSDSTVVVGSLGPMTWRADGKLKRFEARRLPMMDLTLVYAKH